MSDLYNVVRENDVPTEIVVIRDGIRFTFARAKFKVVADVIEQVGADKLGSFTATIVAEADDEKGWTMFQCFDGEQDAAALNLA